MPTRTKRRLRTKRNIAAAFTLVELLVVIIIIGILAAVAVPRFGDMSTDAKLAALDQNLAQIRKSIELYYYHHGSTYPGRVVATHKLEVGEVTQIVGHTSVLDAFTKQLTLYSDANGNTSTRKDSNYPYGPYLRSGMPPNPLPAAGVAVPAEAAAVSVTAETRPLSADAKPTTGWKTSSETGEFIANNSQYASR